MRGCFITFEGPDGAGKTTQIELLGQCLEKLGRTITYTREPGGTRISEEIRKLLLNPENMEMADRTEALLYAAARAQHVEELIKPSLAEGKIVLCDRFSDSTLAYQGYGRGINLGLLEMLNGLAVSDLVPDLTIILDINPIQGLARISEKRAANSGEGKDRIEQENTDFHLRVREGFLQLAKKDPDRYKVVDAGQNKDVVHEKIFGLVKEVLENANT